MENSVNVMGARVSHPTIFLRAPMSAMSLQHARIEIRTSTPGATNPLSLVHTCQVRTRGQIRSPRSKFVNYTVESMRIIQLCQGSFFTKSDPWFIVIWSEPGVILAEPGVNDPWVPIYFKSCQHVSPTQPVLQLPARGCTHDFYLNVCKFLIFTPKK